MGYHKRPIIIKGKIGTIEKIEEELDELKEAIEQNNKILAIVELADLYGAIKYFAKQYNLSMKDLSKMAKRTSIAFKDGSRK